MSTENKTKDVKQKKTAAWKEIFVGTASTITSIAGSLLGPALLTIISLYRSPVTFLITGAAGLFTHLIRTLCESPPTTRAQRLFTALSLIIILAMTVLFFFYAGPALIASFLAATPELSHSTGITIVLLVALAGMGGISSILALGLFEYLHDRWAIQPKENPQTPASAAEVTSASAPALDGTASKEHDKASNNLSTLPPSSISSTPTAPPKPTASAYVPVYPNLQSSSRSTLLAAPSSAPARVEIISTVNDGSDYNIF